jgi:signal transduction histidine kinase
MTRRTDEILLLTPAEQLVFNRFGVRLRYLAAASAITFVLFCSLIDFYPEFPRLDVTLVTLFVVAYNTFGAVLLRNMKRIPEGERPSVNPLQYFLTVLDQLVLTTVFYLFGGLEAFVAPVILLAMFMVAINTGKRRSYWFLASALLLMGALFLLQHYNVLPYHSTVPASLTGVKGSLINPITSQWSSLISTWLIVASLLSSVVYFSNFVKDKYARVIVEILEGRQEITSLRKLSADILDIFPFAVVTVHAESGRIEGANPAAAALLGANLSWIGQPVHKVDDLNGSGLAIYFERALQGEEFKVNNFPYMRATGKRKTYLSITVLAVRKPDGALEKILFCAEDVTERMRREDEQRELQQALLQTEKMASLGQMAAGVAHELNNPLTAIDAYGQMMLYRLRNGESLGPDYLQRIERILENSDRIRKLVQNLLSYARPSPETTVPLNLHTVIDESLIFCEHGLRNRNIELHKEYGELPKVPGNKTQLQQVFINLFTNAMQAVATDQGRIEIRTSSKEDGVVVQISDNGPGIDRNLLERIFEPFFTTKSDGEGTGLGLSIVLTILEKHHGSIQVESDPGKGTTFTLWLPLGSRPTPPGFTPLSGTADSRL